MWRYAPLRGIRRRVRLGIQSKWAALSAVAVGTALVLSAATSIQLVAAEMRASARNSAEAASLQLAKFSLEAMLGEEPDDLALQSNVDATDEQPGVRFAVIYDMEGRVLAASPNGALLRRKLPELLGDDDDAAAKLLAPDESDLIVSRRPVQIERPDNAPHQVGWVRVGYSFAEQNRRIWAFVGKLIAVSLGGLAVGVLMCVLLARRFARPVLRLESLAQRVASRDFQARPDAKDLQRDDELGDLAKAFDSMTDFLRRGQFVRTAFERYVSPALADRIYQSADDEVINLGKGDRREVTVLFLDVRGFTKLSEKMSAEDVVKFLVNFFNRVSRPVLKADGGIDKFIGDAMLAVFGFPFAHADDPARAVGAALEIQRIVEEYNQERTRWGLDHVAVGIGINTGMVVAGTVGCDEKRDYTVIGDAVNVASRLCSLAKAHQILISDSTHERVRRRVNAESLGEQQVKGREQAVEIFLVRGMAEEVPGAA